MNKRKTGTENKMKFYMHKGLRLHKGFWAIQTLSEPMWYSEKHRKWFTSENLPPHTDSSSCFKCHSLRAFRRHLRNHPELNGVRVKLCHREFMTTGGEFNIEATGRAK